MIDGAIDGAIDRASGRRRVSDEGGSRPLPSERRRAQSRMRRARPPLPLLRTIHTLAWMHRTPFCYYYCTVPVQPDKHGGNLHSDEEAGYNVGAIWKGLLGTVQNQKRRRLPSSIARRHSRAIARGFYACLVVRTYLHVLLCACSLYIGLV